MVLFALFVVFFVHASFLGLSDDEAYYWVLSQKLSLGYAFHPPAVAWVIALFDRPLSLIFGEGHPGFVRLPAVLGTVFILYLALKWIRKQKGLPEGVVVTDGRSLCVLLSFFGLFSLSWMMVPDIPLLVSWMILFYFTWNICFGSKSRNWIYLGLLVAAVFGLLSKFSGVLMILSSLGCVWLWAPRERKVKSYGALILGGVIALIPILIWNSKHEWGSLLYQFRDRHAGGALSWVRYGRFWIVETLLAGPGVMVFGFILAKKFLFQRKALDRRALFVGMWIAPASIYLVQPLYSDFKLHWAFIVWLPVIILMATYSHENRYWKWIRIQVYYGITLGLIVLVSCHFPIVGWAMKKVTGESGDPRWDVTHDFYGWRNLAQWLNTELDEKDRELPIVGSRYQTAAQAAFNFGRKTRATLLPRDVKEKDEWPEIGATESWGPDWPRLTSSVLFVGDNRYNAAPEFKGASCHVIKKYESMRFGILAKSFDLWKCEVEQRR